MVLDPGAPRARHGARGRGRRLRPARGGDGRGGALAGAYAVTLLTFLDTFALLPTIGPHAESLGAGPLLVGATVGAYSATNLLANPVAGVLLDRFGRRPVLLAGLAWVIAALLAYPLAASPAGLLVLRLAHGVGGGLVVPSVFTLVGDLTGPADRGRAMGRTGAAIGAAAVIAPPVAGLLAQAGGVALVVVAVAGAMSVGWAVAALALPETAPRRRASTAGRDTAVLRLPRGRLLRAQGAVFAFTFALGGLTGFLPFRVADLGGAPATTGAALGLFAVVAAGLMLSPLADQSRRSGAAGPMALGLASVGLGTLTVGASPTLTGVVAACAVLGLGYALVFPASATEAAAVPGGRRGRAFGLFHAAFSLGFVVGPPAAGALAAAPLGPFAPGAAVALGAAAAVAAWRPRDGSGPARPDPSGPFTGAGGGA